jgi:hypothetical protein
MHTRILANVYFISGYLSALGLFFQTEYYLKALGVFMASYLSYLLSAQLETKE